MLLSLAVCQFEYLSEISKFTLDRGRIHDSNVAVYTAFAARDLGLSSMLLYPGGEPNQSCARHIVTYNLYQSTAVPGGHCACLVSYEDGMMRYDVQGGVCIIQPYQFPEA